MSEDRVPFGTHDPAAAMVNGRTDTPAGDPERAREVLAEVCGCQVSSLERTLWIPTGNTIAAMLAYAAEAVAAERERCAKVADDASHANLNRSNELRQSSDPIDGEYSVAFHRKHREAQAIATAIREQAK